MDFFCRKARSGTVIPIALKPEPPNFSDRVRKPGQEFLKQVPNPITEEWNKNAFWQKVLPDMRRAYNSLCAYCATWIPHSTGSHSIDHFIPKAVTPTLAYEWDNFRYVSSRFNSRKGTRSILDPFNIQFGWYTLDFSSFLIKPGSQLNDQNKQLINDTIKILKLNDDEDLVCERQNWIEEWRNRHITFGHLKRKAPFIAYELQRI